MEEVRPGYPRTDGIVADARAHRDTVTIRSWLLKGGTMANKDKGGSKSSKTAASKSLKEKRQAKKEKAAQSASSGYSTGR
ncbi:MAG TPA: hypothetical protein VF984_15420 [Actinomycetota bacterium]